MPRSDGTTVALQTRRMKRNLLCVLFIVILQLGCGDSSEPTTIPNDEAGADAGGTESEENLSCEAALDRLNETYAQARVCNQNEDCNYIDGPFHGANGRVTRLDIIGRTEQTREIARQDCVTGPAAMQFMIVGNSSLVQTLRSRIETEAQRQQQACTIENTFRCQAFSTAPAFPTPVCRDNQCVVQ